MRKFLNTSYSFTLGGVKINADIDVSLSSLTIDTTYLSWANEHKTLHSHPMHELFFVFDNPMYVKTAYGTTEYRNCILCIPPKFEHCSIRSTDYRIVCSLNFKESGSSDFGSFFARLFSSDDITAVGSIRGELKTYLEELCYTLYHGKSDIENEAAVSALKLIFYHIYLSGAESKEQLNDNKESYYLLTSHIVTGSVDGDEPITIGTIADALHLSKKQASRIIYKYYGKPLSEVLLDAKLKRAVYLLTATDIPISEVAGQSNFHSENYFYTKFKETYGETPLHYRKKHRTT